MMNRENLRRVLIISLIALSGAAAPRAQVAQGGSYSLEQAVIATGGGQSATGGAFSLSGTIGQATAGTRAANSPFVATGGFWTAPAFNPTAAVVSIGGRVTTPDGRGLKNARVYLTDQAGNSRAVSTGSFGYYRFADVAAGATYVVQVVSKRYRFEPQVVIVNDEINDLNFAAAMQSAPLSEIEKPAP